MHEIADFAAAAAQAGRGGMGIAYAKEIEYIGEDNLPNESAVKPGYHGPPQAEVPEPRQEPRPGQPDCPG